LEEGRAPWPPLNKWGTIKKADLAFGLACERRIWYTPGVTLETINAVAQLVAAFGVVASLFYLAAQIRQNTRSMRAVVVDSLAHSMVDLLPAQAPESMRAFAAVVENWYGANDEDRLRAIPFIFATFKVFENAWFQQRHGTLAPSSIPPRCSRLKWKNPRSGSIFWQRK
jgi:hypothetical protein